MNPLSSEVAAGALAAALAELRADSGTVHVKAPDQKVLLLAAWAGPMPEPVLNLIREIPWGKGMAGAAAERVEPVGTCNLQTTTSADVRPGAKATQLRGALVVPMMLGDEVVGTFGIGTNGERTFTVAETRILWERAAQLARRLEPPAAEALRARLALRVPAEAMAWLDSAQNLAEAFPAVSRKLGREPLGAADAVVSVLGEEVPLRAWRTDDAGRALLILRAPDPEQAARESYFQGDLREKAGALRALAVVGKTEAAVDVILDALRLAADELVEAALTDHPFAGKFLPEHEFRRAVLKLAFIGVSVERVAHLERADAELSRMLLGLVSEREAAGRAVPPELWPVAARAPIAGLLPRLLGYLEHGSAAHRAAAARALGRLGDEDRLRARPFLLDRFARETDDATRRAIDWALA
jgi:putative methionine-R-sulfoxide reductase with GAF domain